MSPLVSNLPRIGPSTTVGSRSSQSFRSPPASTSGQSEKTKPFWKFHGSKKESIADSSSLSSATLESQKLEEIPLDGLKSVLKSSVIGKSSKIINVYLSQNSTHALFWTRPAIHIWDVGTTPPTSERIVRTESTCALAAVTKTYLAYIIGTRGQRLTVKHLAILRGFVHRR